MSSVTAFVFVEMQFDGSSGPWTDVTRDVRAADRIRFTRGIRGNRPLDLTAETGTLSFALNNAGNNSASLEGYYSPDHVNGRRGFDLGTPVRVRFRYKSIDRVRWVGLVDDIVPSTGRYKDRKVLVTAVDWMNEAATHLLTNLATQTNVRADQVLSTVVAAMPKQPPGGTLFDQGTDTYAYALDTTRDEGTTALAEFDRVTRSEFGRLYLDGDGRLRFENRSSRITNVEPRFTLDNSMDGVSVRRSRRDLVNKIQAIVHPRSVDASTTKVLFTLNTKPLIEPGGSLTLFGGYVDPDIQAARVGATEMQALVSGSDYTMHSGELGGTDLTSSFTVTAAFGGNGVRFTITNNGTVGGYVTKLQVRGRALYDYERVIAEVEDASSKTLFGEQSKSLDMPYQSSPTIGASTARYLLSLYKSAKTHADSASFVANASDDHMAAALDREISDRIGIRERVSGLANLDGSGKFSSHHINEIAYEVEAGPTGNNLQAGAIIRCTWTLTPADPLQYWLVGVAGRSELGETTVVGPL